MLVVNCKHCHGEFKTTLPSKKYCSESCLNLFYKNKNEAKKFNAFSRPCPVCDKSFEVTGKNNNQKFCSVDCRDKNYGVNEYKKEANLVDRNCVHCNKVFTTEEYKTNHRHCSSDCLKETTKIAQKEKRNSPPEIRPLTLKEKQKEFQKQSARDQVYKRDGYLCYYCGINLFNQDASMITLDHIYPKSLGGPDTASNLVTSCRDCNCKKHATIDASNIDLINQCLEDVNKRNESLGIDSSLKIFFPQRK